MLYILECMFYAFTTMHGGNNKPLMSTGKAMTINDVGVCLLSWWIVFLLVIFIWYCIAYAVRKHKDKKWNASVDIDCVENEFDKKSFGRGIFYILECFILPIKCLFVGKHVTLRTTRKNPTSKEIVFCILSWVYIILLVVEIVLICV